MAKKIINAQMKQRRDTKANWAANNPVLLAGELGIVSDDPNLYKVGDGTTAWNALPFRGFDGTLVHTTGDSDTAVMSQKAVTEKLAELSEEIAPTSSWLFLQSLVVNGEFYDGAGQIGKSESYCRLKLIKTTSSKIYFKGFQGITIPISGRLLNKNKEVIGTINIYGDEEELDIDVNTAYIGFYTQGSFPEHSAIIFSNPLHDEIRDIEKKTDTLDYNLVALERKIDENDILNKIITEPITIKSSGAIMTDGSVNSTTNFGYSQPIKLKQGDILNVKLLAYHTMAAIAVTNENGSFISVGVTGYDSSSNIYDYTYEAKEDCYVVVTSDVNYDRFPKSCLIRDPRVYYYDRVLEQFITEKNKENLLNPNEALVGYYVKEGEIGGTGNTQYIATGFIPVIEGEVYEVFTNPLLNTTLNPVYQKRFRFISFYDENKELVSSSSTEVTSITIPNGVAYMRVTIYRGNDTTNNNLRSVQDACITTFGKYSPFLSEFSTSLNEDSGYNEKSIVGYGRIQKMLAEHSGSLTGQKWVACGDSFTGGGYDGHTESNTFQNEPYAGEYKHYPAYVGRRNNMIIVNEAVGGTSMAWEDVASHESFAKPNGRYTQIPKDADIITLMFGINDKNYDLPLGEEDSTDVTTFYGAWNVVMRYLISNHPDARLGIIITCGAQTPTQMKAYTDIERAIAKKYGVPYLDLAASDKVPYIIRQWEKTEVSDDIKRERDAYYAVSNSNQHPNEKAHLKLSYVIEDWIRSL